MPLWKGSVGICEPWLFQISLLALVEGERGGMEAVEVVERIADSFRAPLVVEQCEIFTSVSIGIAFYPENGKTYEEVVRNADRAMACAKSEGKNTYRFFCLR